MRLMVALEGRAHEMAQEEIQKQVAYLSPDIRNVRFDADGAVLECDVPDEQAERLGQDVRALADRMQRSLRRLQRKVIFRSASFESPVFRGAGTLDDVHILGTGQVALTGLPLAVFMSLDRLFTQLGDIWDAQPIRTPTLIPTQVLARCDYFRSFPQNVTFASHLREDLEVIDSFRAEARRRWTASTIARSADMVTPEVCLSPAAVTTSITCIRTRPSPPRELRTACAARASATRQANTSDLRRLWDFTMREVVFMGHGEDVLQRGRPRLQRIADLLDQHGFGSKSERPAILSSSHRMPWPRRTFQLSSETKYEISLVLPGRPSGWRSAR